jgi:hypothetical protein
MTGAERLREESEARGHAKALLRLLDRKFGPLPSHVTDRVLRASMQDLEKWTDGVMDAKSLETLLH